MKKVDIAARDHLAETVEQQIAIAERHIAAARQALAVGNDDRAMIELDFAATANAAAMAIIEGGIGIGETEARTAITNAFLRGLDPNEP